MEARGELHRGAAAPAEGDLLPDGFWEKAELVAPPRVSVHLKVEPDVFDFFKRGGKGHLTRMQKVLAAYARAKGG